MKKLFFVSILLVVLSPVARAEKQDVVEVIDSSFTVNRITLSSGVATQVDPTSILMKSRSFVLLQNLDTSYDVYCSERSNASPSNGFLIPKGNATFTLPLGSGTKTSVVPRQNRLTLRCYTANPAGSDLVVIQGY